jgi:hypothetical protein
MAFALAFWQRELKKYDLLPCPVVKVAPLVKRYQRPTPNHVQRWQMNDGAK